MSILSTPPHLLHAFPTFSVGGAQVRFAAIANHFGTAFRHTLVSMDGRYDCRERLDPKLLIDCANPIVCKDATLGNVWEFWRLLSRTRPDTLITYNWGSIEWAMADWLHRARHIHIEDGFGPEEARRQFGRRVWTRRIALRRSTVIVPSMRLRAIATQVWKLDPARVRYIPNGIDCARFARAGAHAIGTADPSPLIGTVAALRREKNIARLLRAFARVHGQQPCRLIIVGDGPERVPLERLATELGIASDVTFAGHVTNPEQIYGTFDIFALASDTEQMPYTIIEAMAAGLAIAATDVGDIRHMVAAENGPFVSPPADDLLADALGKLVGDTQMRQQVGIANQIKARAEFDQAKMFAAYGSLFRGPTPSPIGRQVSAPSR